MIHLADFHENRSVALREVSYKSVKKRGKYE
jgi:hypothetical protein